MGTAIGDAMTRMPAACAERMPFDESSIAVQRSRSELESTSGFEIDVRRRLASCDLLGRDGDLEERCEPGLHEDGIDQRTVRRGRDRETERPGEAADGIDGAVDQREVHLVPREHPTHDLVVDLLGDSGSPMTSCM